MTPDTQQVELMGRNLLTSLFIADGIEVSLPLRDRGIDLIAFDDLSSEGRFRALPVQLKASSKRSFSINRKYEKFPDLLMAYVWHCANPLESEAYVMTYKQAVAIADELGWTQTASWVDGEGYSTQKPSQKVMELLQSYKYTPGSLATIIRS